jgi:hypothetical protein
VLGSLIRLRPFLWLLGLVLLAVLISITWENTTSYDDGGLGTAAFLILVTLGAPFLLPSQLLGGSFGGSGWTWGLLYWGVGLVSLFAFYLGLDRLSLAWLRRRGRDHDHTNAGAGA